MSTQPSHEQTRSLLDYTSNLSRREFVRRTFGATLSLGTAASLSAACGRGGTAGSDTITMWHGWTGGVNTKSLSKILKKFGRNNRSDTTVRPTALEWDALFSKLVVSTASGKAPDVVLYHGSEVAQFAAKGVTRPIGELVKGAGLSFENVPRSVTGRAQWEDERHAVPLDVHPLGMYYNRAMVEGKGLDSDSPPQDKEELLDWAKELTVRGSGSDTQYGIAMPYTGAAPRWFWWSLLYQNGGQFLDSAGKCAVDSEESEAALQFLVDLFHRYKVAQPEVKEEADPVARRKAAVWFTGPWEVTQRLQQDIDLATAPMPVIGDRPAAWANTHAQALPKQRGDGSYEAAMTFIAWFYNNYALPAKTVGTIPLSKRVRQGDEFTQDKRYKYYEAFIPAALEYPALEPSIPQYTRIFSFAKPTPLSTNLEAAISKAKPVKTALADMKEGIDKQLAKEVT